MPSARVALHAAIFGLALPAVASFGVPKHTTFATRHAPLSRVSMAAEAKRGIFSPVVDGAKAVMGKDELNKLRAKVIGEHSKVISNFVDTSESKFGRIALQKLFDAADTDGNGVLDPEEVKAALWALGFKHLKDKQVQSIFARADTDENGDIDFEEFVKETPKTIRTNLIKLAKTNGNDLGFLV
mmetsp:Transcript_12510/g.37565  ORF Transcript_12510/g.37565 Transcript_12510/m.37565 type:complete len:184 (+) Transcript_12510:186-737(+)